MDSNSNRFVEAIEEGRIVKVSEDYARREGLVILKKPEIPMDNKGTMPSYYGPSARREKDRPFIEQMPRKPDWREQQVISELLDNFHWAIRAQRRRLGITRKQLARQINEPDEHLQVLETGRLPTRDFILINKIQKALGVNLRKDGKQFDLTANEMMEKADKSFRIAPKPKKDSADIVGSGIEVLGEEI
jgi:ribosome-binding protein aMBF1 (putative translation factor)